jgi:hypothetical protein
MYDHWRQLIKGWHVIDPANRVDAFMDVLPA